MSNETPLTADEKALRNGLWRLVHEDKEWMSDRDKEGWVRYARDLINEERLELGLATLDAARQPTVDVEALRARNTARGRGEDASGGYREVAGCGCEHCTEWADRDRATALAESQP